jgi:hypothetical protein
MSEKSQTVQAGRANEKTARKGFAGGTSDGIDGLPRDEHGDDGGFACASREFEGNAKEFWVCLFVAGQQVIEELLSTLTLVRRDFGEPDGGFNGFDLAEERFHALKGITAPVLE